MTLFTKTLLAASVAVAFLGTAQTFAARGEGKAIPEAKQAKLLAVFGDEGIDADGDGVLTVAEVRLFFAENPPEGQMGRHGGRGGRGGPGFGPGEVGPMGRGGPMGGMGPLIERIAQLESATVPEGIDVKRFPAADKDGDGVLSQEEWTAFAPRALERLLTRAVKQFPDADVDEDGTISADELPGLKTFIRKHMATQHPDADTDGDGQLSDTELVALRASIEAERAERILERHPEADLDGDGTLSKEEMSAFMEDHRRMERPGDGRPERRHGRGGQKGPRQVDDAAE